MLPRTRAILAGVFVLTASAPFATAQTVPSQYREVPATELPLDRPGVWTLNFDYTPVRIVTVDTPLKGKQRIWYMIYRVYNTTDTPQTFYPEFELVTKDPTGVPMRYLDEPRPTILDQIRQIEDPTGALNLQSSISISKNKIPVTKPDSYPRAVYGVAIWPDVNEKSPNLNRFSVYVSGLSNGLARARTDVNQERISRKALQIDFVRPTDNARAGVDDIRESDNGGLGAVKWIYRPTSLRTIDTPEGR
ncbi:MAG: hypothetical protein LC104_14210 [Bacteroidales bacterium]|nr:hypothetical protein [Bacteroidales bacterium]